MSPRRASALLLVLAVAGGLLVRVAGLSAKYTIDHDEAISYLSATCHQGAWEKARIDRAFPYGRWAPAGAWNAFLEPDRGWCLGQIGRDLARFDIHPPLYFWLLHAWVMAFGVHLGTGPSLNLVIFVLGALALFGLAREVLGDARDGALVALGWALSPAVVPIAAEARQYELFALATVLFVWQVVRVARRPRSRRELLLLALATGAGALTHYHFAIVVAAGVAYLAVRLRPRRPRGAGLEPGLRRRWPGRALATALGAIAAGYALLLALHPELVVSLGRQQAQAENFAAASLGPRIDRSLGGIVGFLLPARVAGPHADLGGRLATYALALAMALAIGAAAVGARRRARPGAVAAADLGRPAAVGGGGTRPSGGGGTRPSGAAAGGSDPSGAAMLFFWAWTAGFTLLLYLAFLSHGLAMGGKYLAASWPFLAFAPVLALRLARRRRGLYASAFYGLLLASGVVGALLLYRGPDRPSDPSRLLARADRVLVDSVRRGVLPRITWHLPEDRPVLAADAALLLGPARGQVERLAPPALYATDVLYGRPEARRAILATLRRRHRVIDARRSIWGAGHVFSVEPARGAGRR